MEWSPVAIAFALTLLAGLATGIGSALALLARTTNTRFLSAAVAGVMVFISFDELLPTAREYGQHHVAVYGLVSGMAVMAVSLALMS